MIRNSRRLQFAFRASSELRKRQTAYWLRFLINIANKRFRTEAVRARNTLLPMCRAAIIIFPKIGILLVRQLTLGSRRESAVLRLV